MPKLWFNYCYPSSTQDFFSAGVAGALGTVSDHIDNDTLDLSMAISLIGDISSIDLGESYSFAIEQDTEVLVAI